MSDRNETRMWVVINLRIVLWDIFLFSIYFLFPGISFLLFSRRDISPDAFRPGSCRVHSTHGCSAQVRWLSPLL